MASQAQRRRMDLRDWPKDYGGRGLNMLQSIIYEQELQRVNAPVPFIGFGTSWSGPH